MIKEGENEIKYWETDGTFDWLKSMRMRLKEIEWMKDKEIDGTIDWILKEIEWMNEWMRLMWLIKEYENEIEY